MVVLLLHPGREMRWYGWGEGLRGLLWFVGGWEGVKLFFYVEEREEGL